MTVIPDETVPTAASHGLGVAQRLTAEVAITPLSIVEDSRCPADVLCVQAGQLVVMARVDHSGGSTIRTMALGTTTLVAGGTILLVNAEERLAGSDYGEAAKWFRFTYAPNIAT